MSKLNRGGNRRKRETGNRNQRPATCLIITEGTKTEVNYFKNIKNIINYRYRNREIQKNYPIQVEGTARGTKVLVNEAIKRKSRDNFSTVWVVFDADDNRDFDDAIKLAKENSIEVAWSNESFELWLLLHFQDLKTGISRNQYIDRLDEYFQKNNLNSGEYSKNISNIFDITLDKLDLAISRSEELRNYYIDNKEFSPSNMNPGTTIDILMKELIPYLR